MDVLSLLKGTIVGGVLLFMWSGFTQSLIPWGIKTVTEFEEQSIIGEILQRQSKSGLYYFKDKVAAFIAVKPESYYSMNRFLAIEFITQILVALVITILLLLTSAQPVQLRLIFLGLSTTLSILSVDVQYWNWWGFSNLYSVGIAINRLIGHLLVGFILVKFILI
jgi:hypothetical protein